MKTISCFRDLEPFGINVLTGEACGLSYRMLCDVTEHGKRVLERCFDVRLTLADPWNRGAIGSIMLSPEMLFPIGVFALLESGCSEVLRHSDCLVGIEPMDSEEVRQRIADRGCRRYAYGGTAGSRNRHEFSGRIV